MGRGVAADGSESDPRRMAGKFGAQRRIAQAEFISAEHFKSKGSTESPKGFLGKATTPAPAAAARSGKSAIVRNITPRKICKKIYHSALTGRQGGEGFYLRESVS